MRHLEVFGDLGGIDAEGAFIACGDHRFLLELVFEPCVSVPVVGARIAVCDCVKWVFIERFFFAFFLPQEPVDTLLLSIGAIVFPAFAAEGI